MDDNALKASPRPDDCIDVQDESDLIYWTRELGISRERLAEAVALVGGRVADIRAHFSAPAH